MGWISGGKLLSEYPQPGLFQSFESEDSFDEEKMIKEEIHNYSESADTYLEGSTGTSIQEVPIEVRRMRFSHKYSLSWEIYKIETVFRKKLKKWRDKLVLNTDGQLKS